MRRDRACGRNGPGSQPSPRAAPCTPSRSSQRPHAPGRTRQFRASILRSGSGAPSRAADGIPALLRRSASRAPRFHHTPPNRSPGHSPRIRRSRHSVQESSGLEPRRSRKVQPVSREQQRGRAAGRRRRDRPWPGGWNVRTCGVSQEVDWREKPSDKRHGSSQFPPRAAFLRNLIHRNPIQDFPHP